MSTPKDNFESQFEEALKNNEMPYDESAWKSMNQKISDSGLRQSKYSTGLVAAATIATVITVAASIYFLSWDNKQNANPQYASDIAIESAATNDVSDDQSIEQYPTQESTEQNSLVDGASNPQAANQNENGDPIHKANSNDASSGLVQEEEVPEALLEAPEDNNDPVVDKQSEGSSNEDVATKTSGENKDSYSYDVRADSYEVCAGKNISFNVYSDAQNVDYLWSYNGKQRFGSEVSFNFDQEGTAEVVFEVVRNEKQLYQEKLVIDVKPVPDNEISVTPPSDQSWPEYTFALENDQNLSSVKWSVEERYFGGKECAYLFRKKGEHPIVATIKGVNGCQEDVKTTIETRSNYNLLAPNALEPGSSSHDRSTFIPAALKVLNHPFKMLIYDKNNNLMYQTKRANDPWTGVNQTTNRMAPMDTYVWVVKLKNEKGEEEVFYGEVTLVR